MRTNDPCYQLPESETVSTRMRAVRPGCTKPEVALRSELHRRGQRFRLMFRVRTGDVTSVPDVSFTKQRIAVFLDGCLWHMCSEHGTTPSHNRAYWHAKLRGNVARDRKVSAAMARGGWSVLRFWEHEDVSQAADTIEAAVRSG